MALKKAVSAVACRNLSNEHLHKFVRFVNVLFAIEKRRTSKKKVASSAHVQQEKVTATKS